MRRLSIILFMALAAFSACTHALELNVERGDDDVKPSPPSTGPPTGGSGGGGKQVVGYCLSTEPPPSVKDKCAAKGANDPEVEADLSDLSKGWPLPSSCHTYVQTVQTVQTSVCLTACGVGTACANVEPDFNWCNGLTGKTVTLLCPRFVGGNNGKRSEKSPLTSRTDRGHGILH